MTAGTPMEEIVLDKVFIGSCTNARIEDLRAAAHVVKGRKVAANIKRAMIVPGSGLVKDRLRQRVLTRSSLMLVLNGVKLDAVCALA